MAASARLNACVIVFFAYFTFVFARFGKFFVVAALVLTTGAHWAALQTVAWTTMLVNNLCTQSVSAAVSDTFDGQHPCCLCKAIAAGKKSEKKSEAVSPTLKMEFPLVADRIVSHPPAQFTELSAPDFFAESLVSKPPLPPPRAFFV
jgi:hypothetical protein